MSYAPALAVVASVLFVGAPPHPVVPLHYDVPAPLPIASLLPRDELVMLLSPFAPLQSGKSWDRSRSMLSHSLWVLNLRLLDAADEKLQMSSVAEKQEPLWSKQVIRLRDDMRRMRIRFVLRMSGFRLSVELWRIVAAILTLSSL